MKKISFAFVLVLTLVCVGKAQAAEVILGSNPASTTQASTGPVFTQTLSTGSVSVDVMALQKILNIELGLSLPITGTFGSETKSALIQLQNKYPVDILIPDGLTSGNGIVDSLTITKLNTLATQDNVQLSNFVLPTQAAAPTGPFQRTLGIGSTGDDVALLRQILNSDLATKITYPAGVSFTANVYDQEMADAVSRFQEKYAADILTPAGLTTGTGSVGSLTLAKLNAVAKLLGMENTTAPGVSAVNGTSSVTTNNGAGDTAGSGVSNSGTGINCTQTTYTYGPWGTCSKGAMSFATRTATVASDCPFNETPPLAQMSCDPTCTASTWAYGNWSSCANGVQVRTATKTVDCPNVPYDYPTGPLTQSCGNGGGGGGGGGGTGRDGGAQNPGQQPCSSNGPYYCSQTPGVMGDAITKFSNAQLAGVGDGVHLVGGLLNWVSPGAGDKVNEFGDYLNTKIGEFDDLFIKGFDSITNSITMFAQSIDWNPTHGSIDWNPFDACWTNCK